MAPSPEGDSVAGVQPATLHPVPVDGAVEASHRTLVTRDDLTVHPFQYKLQHITRRWSQICCKGLEVPREQSREKNLRHPVASGYKPEVLMTVRRQLIVAAITDPDGLLVGLEWSLLARAVVAEYLSTVPAVVAPHSHGERFGTRIAIQHLRVISPFASS
ncbi:hypothetical protein E2C01_036113 [Portunus trituberculatus]|uniref:Uncharacterized protein n=1 Tax=Portunus trituberculatus TaxID=210409 RepID=A0A5B7F4W5_PORTR|nr:hypothetical protein [Portunus trituberculatus]